MPGTSLKRALAILLLLAMLLSLGFSTEIHRTLQEPSGDELIEILILLKEQADTGNAVALARRNITASATLYQQKIQDRYAVVEALQETADRTQAPLLKILAREQARGRVDEYRSFYIVNIVYARVAANLIIELSLRPEVYQIIPNSIIEIEEPEINTGIRLFSNSNIEWNIERIGAPAVWDQFGLDGSGVVVGIIDTGVKWDHETLKEKYRGYNPSNPDNPNHTYSWFDAVSGAEAPLDTNGHGTHVTGTILGADPAGENQIGVAPGARWIAARAFDDGSGTAAWLLAAGEFMLAPGGAPSKAPDIINNSWGSISSCTLPFLDEWYRPMVQAWRSAGILPVFAAGNDFWGALPGSIAVPANYPESISVAATNNNNELARFSCRGPGPYPYPDELKPDLAAPGVNIRSATINGHYQALDGTSMAAPHVAGVAALLLSADASLGVDELEQIMRLSAKPLSDDRYPTSPNYGYGYGLVSALGAVSFLLEGMEYGQITGHVLAPGEIPLDAVVTVPEAGRSFRNNPADGRFSFFLPATPAGQSWTLRVESLGYFPTEQLFQLVDKQELDLGQIILEPMPRGKLTGTVIDRDSGEPIPGALIRVLNNPHLPAVSSGDDGSFLLENLLEGSYTINVMAAGYDSPNLPATVSGGETTALTVELSAMNLTVEPMISTGIGYSHALKPDGMIWSWGCSRSGQLGDGTFTRRYTPVPVVDLTGAATVSAGTEHTLAVKTDGTVWAWGDNFFSKLGDGTYAWERGAPVPVLNLAGVIAVAAGDQHSLALTSGGAVWAWGGNGSGQLGDGSTTGRFTPVPVPGLSDVVAVSAGTGHSLALKNDGTVWAWGFNDYGQLGDSTQTKKLTPIQVPGLTGVTAVNAGYSISLALKNDGTVWAWGFNYRGQLGDGATPDDSRVRWVVDLNDVVAVSGGESRSLALRADGTVWIWGMLFNGEYRDAPEQVQNLTGVAAISAGRPLDLALKHDGTLWSLYGNQINLTDVVKISAGEFHSLALRENGTVWAWGLNGYGQLGDGTQAGKGEPVQVPGLTGVVAISAGYGHSLALKSDGTVWAWGRNEAGELGDNTTEDRYTPVQVESLTGVVAISAGSMHSLALKNDGTIWAWGYNGYGALGDGTYSSSSIPMQVQDLTGVSAVSAGHQFSLALKEDGTVWGWGWNGYGQLARELIIGGIATPVQVQDLTDVVAISAGHPHSLALQSDGVVRAWGTNEAGQLGDGAAWRTSPVEVNFAGNGHPVTVYAAPAGEGSVSGGGKYLYGASCTITASPEYGYNFVGWYEGDSLVTKDAEHTFTVTRPITLTARFVLLYGDVDGNGVLDADDAILILRHLVGSLDIEEIYGPAALTRARVSSKEGSIDMEDAILILQYIAGLIDEFPIEA